MNVVISKGESRDRIGIVRADGSRAETSFAKKGPFPHDAVHYAVERHLGLAHGFWGMVATGRHPEEISGLAKAAGHASAARAGIPEAHIVELVQAERLVECFEAEMWGGPSDPETFRSVALAACAQSNVPLPDLDAGRVAAIRAELHALARQWEGGRIDFSWDEADGG